MGPMIIGIHEIDPLLRSSNVFEHEFHKFESSEIGVPHHIRPLVREFLESRSIWDRRHAKIITHILRLDSFSRFPSTTASTLCVRGFSKDKGGNAKHREDRKPT
ncbi:hypothetical protein N8633_01425 [bacterium]|nr:hypothetical protein [bacterium]